MDNMKTRFLFLLPFILLSFLYAVMADSLVMTDGRSFPQVQVDSFVSGDPLGSFSIRMIENNQVGAQSYPLKEEQVSKIDFSPPVAAVAAEKGRTATLALADGRRFEGVTVISFEKTPEGGKFVVRPTGSTSAFPVISSTVSTLQLGTAPPGPPPTQTPFGGLTGLTTPQQTPFVATAPRDEQLKVVDQRGMEMLDQMEKKMDRYSEKKMKEAKRKRITWKRKTPVQKMLSNLWNIVVNILIATVIGSIVVYKCVKTEDPNITFQKALLTGVLLATIPKFLFMGCMYIPICCVNLIVGIIVWYYAARTIIMAMVDVSKSRARTIIILFILMEIAVAIAVGFIFFGMAILDFMRA